ncbi:MAG: hypothetical protein V5A43_07655 [Haloarculaceae archaeon]
MKITVSDDRPPLVPIVAVGLLAGVVAVLGSALLGSVGMAPSGLRSLLGMGLGLLVGLLSKDRVVAGYQARRGGPVGGSEDDVLDDTDEASGEIGDPGEPG